MKSFMQMLLASFGVLALMLAGCSTEGTVDSDGGEEPATDDSVLEDSAVDVDVDVDADASAE